MQHPRCMLAFGTVQQASETKAGEVWQSKPARCASVYVEAGKVLLNSNSRTNFSPVGM